MTRDEMEELKGLAASMGLYDDKNPCKRAVILGKTIKALEQQTCEDAISREDALIALTGEWTEPTDELIHRFIRRIKNLPSVNPQPKTGWIPVSEGLPEDEQEILFSTKTGRVHSGKYHDDDSANQWYSHKDKCRAWNNVVTAWMPLPQPYEPQESEEV